VESLLHRAVDQDATVLREYYGSQILMTINELGNPVVFKNFQGEKPTCITEYMLHNKTSYKVSW